MSADLLELAARAADRGGAVAAQSYRTTLSVETKAHKNDVVSEADRAAQERVIETLERDSGAPVVAEEEDGTATTVPPTGSAWVVDPIDGTANYLRGISLWATSVAAVVDGEPVAAATVAPALGETYLAGDGTATLNGERMTVSDRDDVETFATAVLGWGPQGERADYGRLASEVVARCGDMRRLGSMQLALAYVASGALDAAITTRRPNPWDSMAGVHLTRAAGGQVTDLTGDRWEHDSDVLVASNGRSHDAVRAVAKAALSG
jgi:myo-inositol-1(or 4)-monophosphatase